MVADLAKRQHGVVSHAQLMAVGYSTAAVARAAERALLHRIHRGAYAVGHAGLSDHGFCLAAVLSCGRGAVLSHASAAWLWGLASVAPSRCDVTAPARGHRRDTIHVHHSTILEEADLKVVARIPVTAVPRTLLDLASSPYRRRLTTAIDRAERLDLLELASIDALLERCGRHHGKASLRRALDIYRAPIFSRARSERLFLALVMQSGLPRPAINTFVAGHEIDAYWEEERFAVEIDGWSTHRSRASFESDRLRQEDLKLAGIDSIRFTARRVENEPDRVAERLGRLLQRRRSELALAHASPKNGPATH